MRRLAALLLWVALAGRSATGVAAEPILLLDALAGDGVTAEEAAAIGSLLADVMRDNELIVLDEAAVARVLGPILDGCDGGDPAPCVTLGLQSTPARVAAVVRLTDAGGRRMLGVDVTTQGSPRPEHQLALPVELGRERRVALQVTLFVLDVVSELGPTPPGLAAAAGQLVADRLASPAPDVDTLLAAPPVEDEALTGEPDDALDRAEEDPVPAPPPAAPPAPPAPPASAGPDRTLAPIATAARGSVPPRLVVGSERAYERRRGDARAWLKEKRPHAGRGILELRGGVGIGDLSRVATVLGEPGTEEGSLVSSFIQEAPLYDLVGRAEVHVGYAPATMIDLVVGVGVSFARDEVTVGFMRAGERPQLGDPEALTVVRPYLQPRLRAYLVPLGIAKPYVVAGAEIVFVSDWDFTVTTGEPFPRPRGGVVPGVLGGGGIVFDPLERLGLLIEGTGVRYFGEAAGVRFEGALIGAAPEPLPGVRRWSVGVVAGLQVRL